MELPPRARRIHCVRESIRVKTGTTSACAENTGRYSCWSSRIRNYLRVRGEYPISRNRKGSLSELPPRARRIQNAGNGTIATPGTTSACAENTPLGTKPIEKMGNYLRVRGEYTVPDMGKLPMRELPPRARRIQIPRAAAVIRHGTTSACAENTRYQQRPFFHAGNYLRVRGEYLQHDLAGLTKLELPPRARRILPMLICDGVGGGTTSACAENTDVGGLGPIASTNYLRVRGEYNPWCRGRSRLWELPPRARRIHTCAA